MASSASNISPGAAHISTISTISMISGATDDETTSPTTSQHQSQGNRATLDEVTVLRYINRFRSQHGSAPLQWSSTCARRAHMKANHKAGDNTLPSDYGENLARSTHERWRDPSAACMGAIDHWQEEESRYDYNRPGLSVKTHRFTQNVWKLTTHVGFGVGRAKYKGRSTSWVVAYFYPRGNRAGDYDRNVLRRGSVYDGDDNMVQLAAETSVTRTRPGASSAPSKARTPAAAPAELPIFVRVNTVNTEVKHLRSADKRFHFQMLPDRDIIVRQAEKTIWHSGSRSSHQPPVSSPFRLVLQKNGDLVAYDSSSRAFWSTETANCGPSPYTLTMQDDGHCVLYDGGWVPLWATNARPRSQHRSRTGSTTSSTTSSIR